MALLMLLFTSSRVRNMPLLERLGVNVVEEHDANSAQAARVAKCGKRRHIVAGLDKPDYHPQILPYPQVLGRVDRLRRKPMKNGQ